MISQRTLLPLSVLLMLSTFTDAAVGPRGLRIAQDEREMTDCKCSDFACSYSYNYNGDGESFKPKEYKECWTACCEEVKVKETSFSYGGGGGGGKPKPKPKPKPHPKPKVAKVTPKAAAKPKPKAAPKPKPHPHPHHGSASYSYFYEESEVKEEEHVEEHAKEEEVSVSETNKDVCQCEKKFTDEKCAVCVAGSDECVDKSCVDECCDVKQCKCSEYDKDVCSACSDGDSSCPDTECASVCCDSYEYHQEGQSYKEIDGGDSTDAGVKVAEQSLSGSMEISSMSAALTYGLVVAAVGSAIAAVVMGLRNSNHDDRSVPLTGDYAWMG